MNKNKNRLKSEMNQGSQTVKGTDQKLMKRNEADLTLDLTKEELKMKQAKYDIYVSDQKEAEMAIQEIQERITNDEEITVRSIVESSCGMIFFNSDDDEFYFDIEGIEWYYNMKEGECESKPFFNGFKVVGGK